MTRSVRFCLSYDHFKLNFIAFKVDNCSTENAGLCGLAVSALDFQTGYCGFESRSGRDNLQTIRMPSSYSMCPGLSIKWTGQPLVTDSGTKYAWVIHESKAVQIHVHNNRHCLFVPRVPGCVKNPNNNNRKCMVDMDVVMTLLVPTKKLCNV